jgi:DNA-binding response OmpR family regulator
MKESALVINRFSSPLQAGVYKLLAASGYRVDAAADLEMALAKLDRRRYDVIINIESPRAESWQPCERLRRATGTPIIVVSPQAGAEACVRAINAGADYFLRKPFGPLEFLARVRSLSQRPRLPHPTPVLS